MKTTPRTGDQEAIAVQIRDAQRGNRIASLSPALVARLDVFYQRGEGRFKQPLGSPQTEQWLEPDAVYDVPALGLARRVTEDHFSALLRRFERRVLDLIGVRAVPFTEVDLLRQVAAGDAREHLHIARNSGAGIQRLLRRLSRRILYPEGRPGDSATVIPLHRQRPLTQARLAVELARHWRLHLDDHPMPQADVERWARGDVGLTMLAWMLHKDAP